jgi:hypothetical protein
VTFRSSSVAPTIFANPARYHGSTKWQIKIYDGEPEYEPPHVNVILKESRGAPKVWRVNLDTLEVMDLTPPKRDLPKDFLEEIEKNIEEIKKAWNQTYPRNQTEGNSDMEVEPTEQGSEDE